MSHQLKSIRLSFLSLSRRKFIWFLGFCLFLLFLQRYTFAEATATTTSLAYWPLDETSGTLYADVAQEHDGTCVGDCPAPGDGQVNGGQVFNGSSTGIEVPAATVFDWGANERFSIELWIKAIPGQTCADSNEVFIGRADSSSSLHWSLGCTATTGSAFFRLDDSSGVGMTVTGPTVNDGAWHHVVAMRDGAQNLNLLYVDGVEVASASVTYSATFAAAAAVQLGQLGATAQFEGTLDEITVYNGLLPVTEIRSHYYLSRGYVNLCTTAVQIMPLGDSITTGESSGVSEPTEFISYRKALWDNLVGAGYSVDFVGSQLFGESYQLTAGFDLHNEGHGGWRDDQIANNVHAWLSTTPAHVVLLHIGTNSLSTDPSDVERILDEIDRYDETVTVILARIINRRSYSQSTTDFNNNVVAMAQNRITNGDKIIIVDMENGADIVYAQYPPGDMWDNLHPYATGYTKMATVWMDALVSFLPICVSEAPTIVSAPLTTGTVGQAYQYQVTASGVPVPTFALTAAPVGMTIDAATGLITWAPDTVGEFNVTVAVSNSLGTDSQSFTLTIAESASEAPVFNSLPRTTATVGYNYNYFVTVIGTPAPTFALVTAPTGMTIDAATGLIAWTPDTAGSFAVTVTASNSAGSDSQSFTVTVATATVAPAISSTPVTDAVVGQGYSYSVTATGNPAPTFALVTAPTGMTVDAATGLIAWTPDTAGSFAVTVTASNSAGSDSQSFTVTVAEPSSCPVDMTAYWPLDEVGGSTLFADAIGSHNGTCSGISCPVATVGQVAGGFAFDGGDRIDITDAPALNWSGTDSFSLELWVNTTQSCSGSKVFLGKYKSSGNSTTWWVGCDGAGNAAFYARDSKGASKGTTSSALINDGQWHHVVAVRDGAAAQNRLYVDGVLDGTVAASYAGDFVSTRNVNMGYFINGYYLNGLLDEVAVHGRALAAAEIQQHYQDSVAGNSYCAAPTTQTPVISSTPVTDAVVGQGYSYSVTATGNPAPTFALATAPTGMTIDAATGLIAWTPDTAGSFAVTVTASNSAGSDSQSFTVTVAGIPNEQPAFISSPVIVVIGQLYTYQAQTSGNPAPTYSLTLAPPGMTIDATTGLIAWTPTVTGLFDVIITASNIAGNVSQSFVIQAVEGTPTAVATMSDDEESSAQSERTYLPLIRR